MSVSSKTTGGAAIALAIIFNLPYAYLAQHFDYPGILRRPSSEILTAFAAGGDGLIWAWYVFGLTALAIVPLGIALAVTPGRLQKTPTLVLGASLAAALAGLVQAMGLFRWVFVVPGLARMSDAAEAQSQFDLMNAFAGVEIGEHMGQILMALFIVLVALMQWSEKKRLSAAAGIATTGLMLAGAGGGLALAMNHSDALFSKASVLAYLGLTLWLIVTGFGLLRQKD